MRWKDNSPKSGDTRNVCSFLLFPLKIDRETRWLEHATWKEEYCGGMWFPSEWIDSC